MIGIDSNILIQLAYAEHPASANTVNAVQAEIAHGVRLVFPPLVATEFLHVATDDRRFSPPLTMTEALQWIEDFISNSSVNLLYPSGESFRQTLRWMREFRLGRKRILDTHLAAVLHTSGVRRLLTSNPADFEIFDVFEILTT